jgi:hypothetical protein
MALAAKPARVAVSAVIRQSPCVFRAGVRSGVKVGSSIARGGCWGPELRRRSEAGPAQARQVAVRVATPEAPAPIKESWHGTIHTPGKKGLQPYGQELSNHFCLVPWPTIWRCNDLRGAASYCAPTPASTSALLTYCQLIPTAATLTAGPNSERAGLPQLISKEQVVELEVRHVRAGSARTCGGAMRNAPVPYRAHKQAV